MTLATVAACGAPSDESSPEDVGVSRDLLKIDDTISARAVVEDGRLDFPATGDGALADVRVGKILAGAPSRGAFGASAADQAKNPHGFLRRVRGVRHEGDRVVVDTAPVTLGEAFPGDVVIEHDDMIANALPASAVDDPTALGQQGLGEFLVRRFVVGPGVFWLRMKLTHKVGIDYQPLDVKVSVDHASFQFDPSVQTKLSLHGGHVDELRFYTSGTLDTEIALDVDVTADGKIQPEHTADGWTVPQHAEIRLARLPRARAMQLVGFVPVWEALEVDLLLRCDFAFKGTLHGNVGFHAHGDFGAGGEYTHANGVRALRAGPHFTMEPIWKYDQAGSMMARCSLEPEATLFVYDLLGPSITFGPYVDGRLDHGSPPAPGALAPWSKAPWIWSVQPGVHATFGGRVELLGFNFFDEKLPVFDTPVGPKMTGTF